MKNFLLTLSLFAVLLLGFLGFYFTKNNTISITERRKLYAMPSFTFNDLHKGTYMNDLEKSLQDHFIFRDQFKNIKFVWNEKVFGQKVQNGQFIQKPYVSSVFYEDNQLKFKQSADYYTQLNQEHFALAKKQYYSLIPNKDYYLENNLPHINIKDTLNLYKQTMSEFAQEIDLINLLNIDHYYYSDLHWKHERLDSIASFVLEQMNKEASFDKHTIEVVSQFIGSDGRAISSKHYKDDLIYRTWTDLENYRVIDLTSSKELQIYDLKQAESLDPYSIYLHGPQALLSLEKKDFNPKVDETLYLVRDSYASSFAPYLTQGFKRIVLMDMRYIDSKILGRYINVQQQDTVYYLNAMLMLSKPELLK